MVRSEEIHAGGTSSDAAVSLSIFFFIALTVNKNACVSIGEQR